MQSPGIALWSLVDAGNKPNPDQHKEPCLSSFLEEGVRRNSFEARTECPNGKLAEAFRCASSM